MSDERPPYRSRRPSFSELASEITASHTLESDPPTIRWLDRRIGRALRISAWWLFRTKGGTLGSLGIGWILGHVLSPHTRAVLSWLSRHLSP